VTPIVALQAELAIPEGPLLLAIVVAQLTLLRLYCARESESGSGTKSEVGLALAFWTAQGAAILLNALAVPILSIVTLIALYCFDRDLTWLKRLRPLIGVPLMLAIAAPWLIVRAHVDGVPFSGLTWGEFIRALGGAQDMKWKAAPLTFTLGLVLGFLPGALALVPALKGLWERRAIEPLHRFLLSWIAGYLVYLELISSKPALYTVQAMFPAAAAAVALALDRGLPEAAMGDGRLAIPDYMLRPPAWLVALGMTALFGGMLSLRPAGTAAIVLGAIIVTALFTLAASAARARLPAAWLVLSVAGFALFIAFTLT
jgi:4-amino-4-deoxy-L-arabinose transferase-like glycosyltransferase